MTTLRFKALFATSNIQFKYHFQVVYIFKKRDILHMIDTLCRDVKKLILLCRLNVLVDHVKMALDCFFAVWFVVGNVWIFGGHSSPSDAPKLYRYLVIT